MNKELLRLAAGSAAVCLASWFVLLLTAGNVGLQRSISKGAFSLFELPAVVAGVTATAFAIAFIGAATMRLGSIPLLVGVLIGDAFAGLVLAPLAVGELEPIDAPLVFAAVTVVGLQPAAALAGAWAANRRSHDIRRR
jgi:hypothetical protein